MSHVTQDPHMQKPPSPAPSDHLSIHRAQLAQLNSSLKALRKAVPLLRRAAGGAQHGLISACAAAVAYLPAQPLGLKEGFWSAITAISVVQTEFQATETTARDQFTGAAIGGAIAVGTALTMGTNLLIYMAAIVLSMLTCWALNIASASRIAGSTATIVLLVPHTGSAERMFLSRLGEVGWGICVAIATVWIAARVPARLWASTHTDAGAQHR
jgi:uncharacterized membrane protein YccC